MSPKVTIGIPTRNRSELLQQAIESALQQDCKVEYEILVVDDASDDPKVKTYLDSLQNPLVRIVRRETCGGEAASRNSIIEHMRGEYSLWLDDDDCLAPHALSSHLACLEANPEADVIYANLLRTDANLKVEREYTYKSIPAHLLFYALLFYSPFPNGSSLIKKSLFDRAGTYDTTFPTGPDYDFWVRAAAAGAQFVHNNNAIYYYRGHSGNLALAKEDQRFMETNTRVVKSLLQRVPLAKIFPVFDWAGNPDQAIGLSMLTIAVVLFRYRQFELALDSIAQSQAKYPTADAVALKGSILKHQGKFDAACEQLENAYLSQSKNLQNLFSMAGLIAPKH